MFSIKFQLATFFLLPQTHIHVLSSIYYSFINQPTYLIQLYFGFLSFFIFLFPSSFFAFTFHFSPIQISKQMYTLSYLKNLLMAGRLLFYEEYHQYIRVNLNSKILAHQCLSVGTVSKNQPNNWFKSSSIYLLSLQSLMSIVFNIIFIFLSTIIASHEWGHFVGICCSG